MYRVYNVNNPKIPLMTADDLVTLWQELDRPDWQHKTPVIVNDDNEIVAGHVSAFEWAKLKNFNLTTKGSK